MDRRQEKLINLARICLANRNYDKVKELARCIDLDLLSGTVFDKNLSLSYSKIDQIISELQSRRKIKCINSMNYDALVDNELMNLSLGEIEATFATMERNLDLFNKKFKSKIFRLDTNDGNSSLVSIGECNFFHLLGLELNRWQEQRDSILSMFPEFKDVLDMEYREICINNDSILLDTLYVLLEKKERVIEKLYNQNPSVSEAFNMNKIKIKNYLFERSDFTTSPSALINYKPKGGVIRGDLFLLRDYINNNSLEWGVSSFRAYNEAPPKSLESILYKYFRGKLITSLQKNITISIGSIDAEEFNENLEMEEIPITTRFGNNELEYFNRIVRGYNPVITSKELKKKRTR